MSLRGYPAHTALWGVHEVALESSEYYANPLQECRLTARFEGPSGAVHEVDGFWDGGRVWRVRFMPDEAGAWTYTTAVADGTDRGLESEAEFVVTQLHGGTPFQAHGAVGVSKDRRYFVHRDGTPFFWMGDTAWNGPMGSRDDEWAHYLRVRSEQGFNTVQWVSTQWRVAPLGDVDGRVAYTGRESIMVNPPFFRRLDGRIDEMNRAGFLSAIVMLWAHPGRAYQETNPGYVLPEDQAILLGRYMVARWGAYHVAWILAGDGDYTGENTGRWHRIGDGIFGGRPHAPTAMHFRGKTLQIDDFRDQGWLDIMAYQSGHHDDAESMEWIFDGPVARRWREEPAKVLLNSEPCYENHRAPSGERFDGHAVRRACYWSMLAAPTTGITYGAHGVWGWDNGRDPAVDHPYTGMPLAWRDALLLEAGTQMRHLRAAFERVEWWNLRPAPEIVLSQPDAAEEHVSAGRTVDGAGAVIYTPVSRTLRLDLSGAAYDARLTWIDVRNGQTHPVAGLRGGAEVEMTPPGSGDWLLVAG